MKNVWSVIFCIFLFFQEALGASPEWLVYWRNASVLAQLPGGEKLIVLPETSETASISRIAAGDFHWNVVLSNGRVFGGGDNGLGQAFGGSGEIFGWKPVGDNKALKFISTFRQSGEGEVTLNGVGLTNVKEVVVGVNHNVAIHKNEALSGWGGDFQLESYQLPHEVAAAKMVACGRDADWFVMPDDSVIQFCRGKTDKITGLSNIVHIAATTHERSLLIALDLDGSVYSASVRDGIQVLHPPGTGVTAIAAGGWQTLVLDSKGKVAAHYGFVPPQLTNAVVAAIAVGARHSLALKSDGTVVSWGEDKRMAYIPIGLSNVVAIAAGNGFSLAITTNSAVAERFLR